MHKNSFLNGHKGAVSTLVRRPLVWPRLKTFLKAGRSRHVEFSYTDILLKLNCFILYIFCYKSDNGRQSSAKFQRLSASTQAAHCSPALNLHFFCSETSRSESNPLCTYTNAQKPVQNGPQKGIFACDQREPAFLWLLWSPTLVQL